MTSPLVHEKIWFEKAKYEEAERQYFENLAKLLGIKNDITSNRKSSQPLSVVNSQTKPVPKPVRIVSPPQKRSQSPMLDDDIPPPPPPPAVNRKDLPDLPPLHPCSPSCIVKEIILTGSTNPQPPQSQSKDDKRFKPKEAKEKRNKADKKGRERRNASKDENKGSPNTPNKHSLAGEVAKARQHIKNSLECMDGIAALATTANVEVVNRINTLEKENLELKKHVDDLKTVISKIESRVGKLESHIKTLENKSGASPAVPSSAPVAKTAPVAAAPTADKAKEEVDDDGVDLFGSDSEEESEDAKKLREARLAAYSAKKSKKPALIAKSNIILDVKPWDDETDMKLMEVAVRAVSTDGLLWGASKLVPLAYGIHKLQISCVVEDDKVSVDWLQEQLEQIEDYVQSVDIAAFNKV
ncbi:probable elongation factor 1-delta [Periplaneta americana]|uniref:probable elongation factor 1-delta n=1 Tax=Periplaneta americana TaxID=6978 RepID=UPI0037E8596B